MQRKKINVFIAMALVALILAGTLIAIMIPKKDTTNKADITGGEQLIKKILDEYTVDEVISELSLNENVLDSTNNYIMVDAMRFDFTNEVGISDGTTYLYYDRDSGKIERIMHNYVSYTNESNPKTELENVIGNIQGNITSLLGNPSQPFVLMNTSGEFDDYSGLSIDEMIGKLIEGQTVMYTMYESDGLRYEMNLMYSDNTIYMMVWIYNESEVCVDENCEHDH